ncbi:acyl carrier protein [Bacillus halotolerans]|uniref:acyl carrier protein n=1 Tax=Bacillus mojavensis subgroup TaxID=653388 RepID=UPI002DB68BD3|nr:acyl carrier protein [Bacillus mojavensis]MEC1686916.1 acyl carrier protein [Bacillus mojavensis]
MTQLALIERVKNCLQRINIVVNELNVDAVIGRGELELDSIKFMEFFVELENEFNIVIDYREIFQNGQEKSLSVLLIYLENKLNSTHV